jgi:transcriptional regulator with XRE-family HTH domain
VHQLAKVIEMSPTAVGEIEQTKRDVRLETLGRIARGLNDRPSNLITEVVDEAA